VIAGAAGAPGIAAVREHVRAVAGRTTVAALKARFPMIARRVLEQVLAAVRRLLRLGRRRHLARLTWTTPGTVWAVDFTQLAGRGSAWALSVRDLASGRALYAAIVPSCNAEIVAAVLADLFDVHGAPLVVKLLEGTQGIGVVLCETAKAAESVIEAFRGLDANILVQEFIKEAKGADLRAFVVGDKVIASMMRQGAPGEFRSNLHRGGSASRIKLTPEERSTAVRSAKAMGLRMCGVDLLRSNHGPVVMEVNSSPGLEGIEESTGIDVAGKIIAYIEGHAGPNKNRDRIKA